MFQSAGIVCIAAIVMGIMVLESNARHGMEQIPKEKSIECYECNSEYDPRCGDPFNPYTIGKVNCSMKRPKNHIKLKPTLCRKTVQRVQGHVRVIRGCGYIPDDRDDKECILRTGTHDVHVSYCSCKHNLCNGANFKSSLSRITLGGIIFAIVTVFQME